MFMRIFLFHIITHFIVREKSLLLDEVIDGEKEFAFNPFFSFSKKRHCESESPNYPRCSVAERQLLCIASNVFQLSILLKETRYDGKNRIQLQAKLLGKITTRNVLTKMVEGKVFNKSINNDDDLMAK